MLSWNNVNLSISGKELLHDVNGALKSGEIMALMGPSGSGKTTLLNILAHRSSYKDFSGEILVNGSVATKNDIRKISNYVEQEDSLIGALTVRETIDFSAQFSGIPAQYRKEAVDDIIELLGLQSCANTKIGTPLQKGISGGQKRRVSIASQMITKPAILFLDEPTSGLDSVAAREVVQTIKRAAVRENMMVICSIHQPSTFTFELFDKVLFLSKGQTIYNGRVDQLTEYFDHTNHPIPQFCNPSEFVLDLINTDFTSDETLDELILDFSKYGEKESFVSNDLETPRVKQNSNGVLRNTMILLKRAFIKSNRDVLAYHVRIIMYFGLAIMMGTVWLRLDTHQKNIQPFINAIFFSGAFMSFMSVAYIPAYIEDYYSYKKDYLNGLYGPFSFMMANFLIGLPYIFIITLIFSLFTYFMVNFHQTFVGFAYYVLWLFLDLVAAESMVTFISSLFPNFVVALALTAFANGLWMSVGGFLVASDILNPFWYYTFYWVNYQRYVFQGMMFNEFSHRDFECDSSCHCLYDSELSLQCKISGNAVLENNGYSSENKLLWLGILLVLIFAFRLFGYLSLKFRK